VLLDARERAVAATGLEGARPVIDGRHIVTQPMSEQGLATHAQVPLLLGHTETEATLFFRGDPRNFQLSAAQMRARLRKAYAIDDAKVDAIVAAYRQDAPDMTPSDILVAVASDVQFRLPMNRAAEIKSSALGQPILVREHLPDQFEIVFGHRRHRACLELGLPVLAAVAEQSLGDIEVFLSMERENRERADLSPFEQGQSYVSALDAGLFPSLRRLAEAVGVSHTWVRKSMLVAQLPDAVIQAFRSPLEIQPKHAEVIATELERDQAGIMRRAERLRLGEKQLTAAQTVQALLPRKTDGVPKTSIQLAGRDIGCYSMTAQGRLVISLNQTSVEHKSVSVIITALTDAIAATASRRSPSTFAAMDAEK